MKKYIKIVFVLLLFVVNGRSMFGQQTRTELGDKYFDQFDYKKAIILYEDIDDGQKTWQIFARLGDCYYNTSRPETALKYYKKAIDKNSQLNPTYLHKYALCLQSTGSSEEKVIQAFQAYYDSIGKSDMDINSTSVDSSYLEPENLSINTKFSEFGAYIHKDTLFFSSARENPDKKRRYNKRLYKWNSQPYLDVYTATVERNNDAISLNLISPDSSLVGINTVAHQSSVAITNDGKTMYFSSGDIVKKGKMEYNEQGTSILKLRRASLVNNRWIVTEADKKALTFLDYDNYSIGNPTLSPDNKRLLFVTCAPFSDAVGRTDIYYINIYNDGSYGQVKSIPGINTNGRESFPYISADGTLYFSSDGIFNSTLGFGLMDIYKVDDIEQVIEGKIEAKVEHLKSPFNTEKDDFSFFIEESKANDCEAYAYFSSNYEYPNAKGDDDIYRVKIKKTKTVTGIVSDSKTKKPLGNASVELIDASGRVLNTVRVDSTGLFSFEIDCSETYRIRGSKNRYYDGLKEYEYDKGGDSIDLMLKAYPCEISINHIEFNFESDAIRPDANQALTELLEILLTNPDIHVKVESHTDSRGSVQYNLDLSERRAQNTKSYLIGKGVKESQILSAVGFGESCPVVSEEVIDALPKEKREAEHERNRRSLFILDCNDVVKGCGEE